VPNPHAVVHHALRQGRLIREACVVCGDLDTVAHHADYNKPLQVVWLCRSHHRMEHIRLARAGEAPVREYSDGTIDWRVRIPVLLARRVAALAEDEGRSATKQAAKLIEEALNNGKH
jgi:hypothetical protein